MLHLTGRPAAQAQQADAERLAEEQVCGQTARASGHPRLFHQMLRVHADLILVLFFLFVGGKVSPLTN